MKHLIVKGKNDKLNSKNMVKVIFYKKDNGVEKPLATIYIKDGKLAGEADDPKVKKDLDEIIRGINTKGVSFMWGATIEINKEGKLLIYTGKPPDIAFEEAIRRDTTVERTPQGFIVREKRYFELSDGSIEQREDRIHEVPYDSIKQNKNGKYEATLVQETYLRTMMPSNDPQFLRHVVWQFGSELGGQKIIRQEIVKK